MPSAGDNSIALNIPTAGRCLAHGRAGSPCEQQRHRRGPRAPKFTNSNQLSAARRPGVFDVVINTIARGAESRRKVVAMAAYGVAVVAGGRPLKGLASSSGTTAPFICRRSFTTPAVLVRTVQQSARAEVERLECVGLRRPAYPAFPPRSGTGIRYDAAVCRSVAGSAVGRRSDVGDAVITAKAREGWFIRIGRGTKSLPERHQLPSSLPG